MPIDDLLNRLEAAEQRFSGSLFLAPLRPSGQAHERDAARVSVRIAGVVCRLRITRGLPASFSGWGIFRALSASQAEFARPASLGERAAYLGLLPSLALILVHPTRAGWVALPARQGDTRFRLPGPVLLELGEDGLERFETVLARFDGTHFWYDRRDPSRDPALAAYLRETLARNASDDPLPVPAEALHKRGLSREEREAYRFLREALQNALRSQAELRLADALAHSGASLLSSIEREGAYVVTYQVDGRRHTS